MRGLLILATVPLLAAVGLPKQTQTPLSSIRGYRNWTLVTPQPVDMAPAIATSCMGPSLFDSDPNPHAPKLFKVYVNPIGKAAMTSEGKEIFPVGSMIVKEKFTGLPLNFRSRPPLPKDAKPVLLTAMVKREKGFDAPNGDWEYIVLTGDGARKTTDGLSHCTSCHAGQKKNDFVFGDYGSIQHGRFRRSKSPL